MDEVGDTGGGPSNIILNTVLETGKTFSDFKELLSICNDLKDQADVIRIAFADLNGVFKANAQNLREVSQELKIVAGGGIEAMQTKAASSGAKAQAFASNQEAVQADLKIYMEGLSRKILQATDQAMSSSFEMFKRRMQDTIDRAAQPYVRLADRPAAAAEARASWYSTRSQTRSDGSSAQMRDLLAAEEARLKAIKEGSDGYSAQISRVKELREQLAGVIEQERVASRAANEGGFLQNRLSRFSGHANSMADMVMFGAALYGPMETIKQVAELDKSFGELQAITQTSNTQMTSLRATIVGVAQNSNVAAKDIIDATTILAKFGMTADQVKDSLKGVVDFASAIQIKPEEAAQMLTGAMGAYNMPASSMGNIADLVTGTVAKSRISTNALNSGLNMTAEIAAEVNIPLKELVGTLAMAADAGVRMNERFGMGFRQLITALAEPSAQLKTDLAHVGLNIESVDVKTKGLVGVLQTMHNAGFDASAAMRNLGAEGAAFYNALGKNINSADEFINKLSQTGSAAAAAERNLNTLSGAMTRLKNTWETVMSSAGESSFSGLLKGIADATSGILGLIGQSQTLSGVLATVGAGLGAASMVGIMGGASTMLAGGGFAAGIGAAISGPIIGPILAATAALAAIVAVVTNLKKDSAADRLDASTGTVQDLQKRGEENQKLIESIDETSQKLAQHGEVVGNAQGVIDDLRNSYGKLGLQVDVTGNKTQSFLDLLRQFRADIVGSTITSISDQVTAVGDQAEKRKAVLQTDITYDQMKKGRGQGVPWVDRTGNDKADAFISQFEGTLRGIQGRNGEVSDADLKRLIALQAQLGETKRGMTGEQADKVAKAIEDVGVYIGKIADILGVSKVKEDLTKRRDALLADSKDGSLRQTGNAALAQAQKEDAGWAILAGGPDLATNQEAQVAIAKIRQQNAQEKLKKTLDQSEDVLKNEAEGPNAPAAADLKAKAEAFISHITGVLKVKIDDQDKFVTEGLQADIQLLQNQQRLMTAKMSQAKTTEQVGIIESEIDKLVDGVFEVKAAQVMQAYEKSKMANPGDPNLLKIFEGQLGALIADRNASREQAGNTAANRSTTITSSANASAVTEAQSYSTLYNAELSHAQSIASDKYSVTSKVQKAIDDFAALIDKAYDAEIKTAEAQAKQATDKAAGGRTLQAAKLTADSNRTNRQRQLEDMKIRANTPLDQFSTFQRAMADQQGGIQDALAEAGLQGNLTVAQSKESVHAARASGASSSQLATLQQAARNAQLTQVQLMIDAYKKAEEASRSMTEQQAEEISKLQATRDELAIKSDPSADDRQKVKDLDNQILTTRRAISGEHQKVLGYQEQQLTLAEKLRNIQEQQVPQDAGGALGWGIKSWQKDHTGTVFDDIGRGVPQVLNTTEGSFARFVTTMQSGTVKVGTAFREMAISILQSAQRVAANALAEQMMKTAISSFGGLGGLFGGDSASISDTVGSQPAVAAPGSMMVSQASVFSLGGIIPWRRASLGYSGVPTRDSVHILAEPGEGLLTQSAMSLLGPDTVDSLNSLGNRRISQAQPIAANQNKAPQHTNVYVVAPGQQPTGLGPNDVLHVIGQDILTGGQTKKLIKTVIAGG